MEIGLRKAMEHLKDLAEILALDLLVRYVEMRNGTSPGFGALKVETTSWMVQGAFPHFLG